MIDNQSVSWFQFEHIKSTLIFCQGILAEILDFVMGKGLIPADGEIWRVRRRAIVPAVHQKVVPKLIQHYKRKKERYASWYTVGETVDL